MPQTAPSRLRCPNQPGVKASAAQTPSFLQRFQPFLGADGRLAVFHAGLARQGQPALSRLALQLYRSREDLRVAFPDVLGTHRHAFAAWFRSRAGEEAKVSGVLLGATTRLRPQRPTPMHRRPTPPPASGGSVAHAPRPAAGLAAVPRGLPAGLERPRPAASADHAPGAPACAQLPDQAGLPGASGGGGASCRRQPAAVRRDGDRLRAGRKRRRRIGARHLAGPGLHVAAPRGARLPRRQRVAHGRERRRGAGHRRTPRDQPVPHQRRPDPACAGVARGPLVRRAPPHRLLGLGTGALSR
jgi:hypothetical protein